MEWVILKTLFSLAAVLGLMFALMVVMRRFFYGGDAKSSSVVNIEILGSRTLAPKRSVHVLQIMDKVIVVGMTEQGMQTLTEMDGSVIHKETMIEHLRHQDDIVAGKTNFPSLLSKHLNSFVFKGAQRLRKV